MRIDILATVQRGIGLDLQIEKVLAIATEAQCQIIHRPGAQHLQRRLHAGQRQRQNGCTFTSGPCRRCCAPTSPSRGALLTAGNVLATLAELPAEAAGEGLDAALAGRYAQRQHVHHHRRHRADALPSRPM